MPAKYLIHSHPAPPKHAPVGKYCIIDWREDCSACHNCVKRECAYQVYDSERDRLRDGVEYVDYLYECKGCLCCVQSCAKGLLTQQVNPEYADLGDEVWTPDIISSTWFQAEAGHIPVSGAGYHGPFRGPGFDSILTDMSEIVRPTRDGIHGREYISAQVDIGRKPMKLEFNADGTLATDLPPQVELPLPVLFNIQPWHAPTLNVSTAIVEAAGRLGTLAITDEGALMGSPSAIPQVSGEPPAGAKIAQWPDSPDVLDRINKAKAANPSLVAIVKLPLGKAHIARAIELAKSGVVDALHVYADWHGYVGETHISLAVRELHQAFVGENMRDQITVIASGGISLAEHVVKSLLCGADLVAIDVPLMIALECRVCRNCRNGIACPVGLGEVDRDYAVQRMVNLMGAWHSQMIEMMGAMGIRDARRLRGELGRAMFFDDLESECFAPIFGTRKADSQRLEVS
jgi:ferredoxin